MVPNYEKRSAFRMTINTAVQLTREQDGSQHQAICRDMSVDGVLVETELLPEPGEHLLMQLQPGAGASSIQPLLVSIEVLRVSTAADCNTIAGKILETK
jgi:hypothetical protein